MALVTVPAIRVKHLRMEPGMEHRLTGKRMEDRATAGVHFPSLPLLFQLTPPEVSRREIKASIAKIGKSNSELKKVAADLKKKVTLLEKENKRLVAEARKRQEEIQEKHHEDQEDARLTSRGVRTPRRRLRVTQADFAKLLGTSPHAVHLWEKKQGFLRLRRKTREALISITGLGAREAKTKLDEMKGAVKRNKSLGQEKRKRS